MTYRLAHKWRYKVSAGTGWPGVSILWLGAVESLICNFCRSIATHILVWADPSLRYSSLLLGCLASNQPTAVNLGTDPITLGAVCWLVAICLCVIATDLLRQLYMVPHWERSCRSNWLSHPVPVYWHRADQSERWHYNARRLAGKPVECHCLSHCYGSTRKHPHAASWNRARDLPLSRWVTYHQEVVSMEELMFLENQQIWSFVQL